MTHGGTLSVCPSLLYRFSCLYPLQFLFLSMTVEAGGNVRPSLPEIS